ncbi:MAG: uridine kinase [Deltaproteobacteria bacterium]|nr:uridine kinase [Deltaproteobacteria bacterium]
MHDEIRPLMVGIAGGTGSGKSTVARKIAAGLPSGAAVVLEHDAYYRDHSEVPHVDRALLNYDHPDALDNELLVRHLGELRCGRGVDVPIYDFKTHARRAETRRVEPARVIILEGILVFVEESIRALLDMKIFVDTDADIRIMRRVRRDIEERGRDFASVREQYYRTVRPMHQQFVEPSKRCADLVIPEGGENRVALDTIVGKLLYVLSS